MSAIFRMCKKCSSQLCMQESSKVVHAFGYGLACCRIIEVTIMGGAVSLCMQVYSIVEEQKEKFSLLQFDVLDSETLYVAKSDDYRTVTVTERVLLMSFRPNQTKYNPRCCNWRNTAR